MSYFSDRVTVPHTQDLIQARTVKRLNRFIVEAKINGKVHRCYCPNTGRVGNTLINKMIDMPCLVSGPFEGRKTEYTLEAIALWEPEDPRFQWIGINQSWSNNVISELLSLGSLNSVIGDDVESVKKEVKLGSSRIDLRVNDNVFVEIKTLSNTLYLDPSMIPSNLRVDAPSHSSTDRMVKQLNDLADALEKDQKAFFLSTFQYDAEEFIPPRLGYNEITEALGKCKEKGLETWQVNLKMNQDNFELLGAWEMK